MGLLSDLPLWLLVLLIVAVLAAWIFLTVISTRFFAFNTTCVRELKPQPPQAGAQYVAGSVFSPEVVQDFERRNPLRIGRHLEVR